MTSSALGIQLLPATLANGIDLIKKSHPQPLGERRIELPVNSAVGEKGDAEIAFVKTDDHQIAQSPDRQRPWLAGEDAGFAEMAARTDPPDDLHPSVVTAEHQFRLARGDHEKHLAGIPLPVHILALGDDLHPGSPGIGFHFRGSGILEQDGLSKILRDDFSFHTPRHYQP